MVNTRFMEYFKTIKEISREKRKHLWDLTLTYWDPVIIHSAIQKKYWNKVKDYFPQYQWYLLNQQDEVIGLANTVPINFNDPLIELPDRGWDWMVDLAIQQHEDSVIPNTVGGLQIVIFKEYRNQGYSKKMLQHLKMIFKESDLDEFILPIRPILKENHPEISMEEYLDWLIDDLPYDPWIRLHFREGAELVKVCNNSMEVTGSKIEWMDWTGISINGDGAYAVPGGLTPIQYNESSDVGTYREPNIWVRYTK